MTFDLPAAADLLLRARRMQQRLVPKMPAPGDTDSAYAVQEAVMAGLKDPGGVWKMALLGGLTREAAILPCAALHDSGARPQRPTDMAIEVETALILARDPGENPTLDAIAEVRLAFELIASRLDGVTDPLWHMADGFRSAGVVLGDPIPGWRDGLPDILGITLTLDGAAADVTETPAPMAEALDFLGWLSSHAARQNRPLKRGDVVITGARIGPLPLRAASRTGAKAMGATVCMG